MSKYNYIEIKKSNYNNVNLNEPAFALTIPIGCEGPSTFIA